MKDSIKKRVWDGYIINHVMFLLIVPAWIAIFYIARYFVGEERIYAFICVFTYIVTWTVITSIVAKDFRLGYEKK